MLHSFGSVIGVVFYDQSTGASTTLITFQMPRLTHGAKVLLPSTSITTACGYQASSVEYTGYTSSPS
jgi:hypothetical protein